MAFSMKQDVPRGVVAAGRWATWVRRIVRARSRFVEIARSDGVGHALLKAARKIVKKLGAPFLTSAARLGSLIAVHRRPPPRLASYEAWLRVNRDNPRRRRALDTAAARSPGRAPRFSVIVPVYNPPIDVLRAMIQSVLDQSLADWELVLADDASPDPRVRTELAEWPRADERVRVVERWENGNISAATNTAAGVARGDFLVLLDHDDLLHPDALAHLAVYLNENPDVDLVYSDDDKVDARGQRHSPQFKPDWSPELLLSFCYTGHLTAVRRELYHQAGGMRVGFEGSQDHDFWLRASELAQAVGHVPQVLYHWRVLPGSTALSGHCKPESFEAGRRAVEQAFHRRGVRCRVEHPEWALRGGCAIFAPVMPDDGPSVAILIPSRNHGARLKTAIDSIAKTTYRNYHIVVIDNMSDDPATLEYLASLPYRVLRIPNPGGRFSFAAINNTAAAMVAAELLLFLNDDTEVIEPRWLSQMVGWSRLEGVGAVGARLLYPDGRVQHAGVVHGVHDGLAGHALKLLHRDDWGPFNLAKVSRTCSAVTAACMLTPRSLFLSLGCFDESRFSVAYNDPDYCHRLADAGYRAVYCAEAELYHHEGMSRGFDDDPREPAAYRAAHGRRVDPYMSPHYDPHLEAFIARPTVVPVGSRTRPIPLLAVTHNLNWEGAPRFEFELIRRLHASGAIRAEVISPFEGPLQVAYEREGIPIQVVHEVGFLTGPKCTRQLYRDATERLARYILDGGFEVVHANTLQTFWAVEAARRAGVPSVWSVHESEPWPVCYRDIPRDIIPSALACLAYPYRVAFTSRSSAEAWGEFNTSGNFDMIRVARDRELLRAMIDATDRERARRDLGLEPGDVCVLLLGSVCERKGQHDLVSAFAGLPESAAARLRCIVVGMRDRAEYSRRLRAMVAALPADRRDRFTLVDETGETAAYWAAADVFCCTSRVESYPLVILEAMAAGLPIVTTPVNGISEQVRPGRNALTYQPGDVATLADHLTLLARDDTRRRAMAESSPHVFRSLPDDAFMRDRYRQTFEAAAQSAPMFDPPRRLAVHHGRPDQAAAGSAPHRHRGGAPAHAQLGPRPRKEAAR
ncbi:MAG: glycosyltransferase [Isosphaeraceae bacterium]